jgi:hypothetical protein
MATSDKKLKLDRHDVLLYSTSLIKRRFARALHLDTLGARTAHCLHSCLESEHRHGDKVGRERTDEMPGGHFAACPEATCDGRVYTNSVYPPYLPPISQARSLTKNIPQTYCDASPHVFFRVYSGNLPEG